jgi:hypothetical protein
MKKYRLVKEYPGSAKLGTMVEKCSFTGSGVIGNGKLYTNMKGQGVESPEKYPEYWEEVIEKDYEVLSYIKKGSTACTTTKRRGGENHDEYWNIYSVKRLSDGEVFTVGDKITGYHKDARSIQTIRTCPYTGRVRLEQSGGYTDFSYATKVKQPIFLTHNGKNIFEGDKVWYVNKEQLHYSGFIAVSGVTFRSNINAYFLTREGAEDYIEKNKVLFTTEDGYNVFDGQYYFYVDKKDLVAVRSIATSKAVGMSTSFKYFGTIGAAEKYIDSQKILFTTEDGVGIKKDEVVYVVDGRLNSIDMISNFIPKDYPTFKAFSTSKAAEDYIIENKYALSIKEFWEITCMSTSNFNKNTYMKDLVKERLGL